MPTAETSPKSVEMIAETTARTTVLRKAAMVAPSLKSSAYHLSEKPAMTLVLLEELKEKTINTTMGV